MSPLLRKWLSLIVIVIAVIALDQVTKQIVIDNLRIGESYRLIPPLYPLFQITRSANTGAAFGFLPQGGDLFLIIELVVVVILLIYYPRIDVKERLTRWGIALVIGGALGNAADRLTHGAVIDFIHYQIPGVISNVSNLADHAIVIGVIVIFVQSWRSDSQRAASTKSDEHSDQPIDPA